MPILALIDLSIGAVDISFATITDYLSFQDLSEKENLILHESRMPRVLTALICGVALSIAGLLMQTLFRNPLAGPYILGISSGSALGVAIFIMGASFLGLTISMGIGVTLGALLGAFGILFILFLLSIKIKDIMTLLIVGILMGAIATAIIGILQFFAPAFQIKSFLLWTLGSLDAVGYADLKLIYVAVFVAVLATFLIVKPLNAILFGETYAKSIGVNILQIRLIIILITAVLTAFITAYCGPIGFIGIVVPHLSRLLFKTNKHEIIIPSSILMGSCLLLFTDAISNGLIQNVVLPINSITALMGIPIIIWIILSKQKISSAF